MADRILVGKALQVLGSCLGRYLWDVGMLWRRNDIEGVTEEDGLLLSTRSCYLMIHTNHYLLVLAERSLGKAILAVLGCPDHHIALAGRKEGGTISTCIFGYYGAELCIVVDFEVHLGTIYRIACCIYDFEIDAGRRTIVVDEVDLGIVGSAEHYLLRTIVIAERLGMHQHRTGCRSIKPSQVQYSFRLAGSQEIPGSICPSLYPGVVIIGMCPAWGINLACRNANSSQGSYRKGTLLTAAAVSRTDGRKRCRSTAIGWLIGYQLVAPVVYLEDSILHTHTLYALLQFLEKYHTRIIQILIVDAYREHEVAEEQLRHLVSPSHLLACLETGAHILQEEAGRIVGYISHRHVGIEKLQGSLLIGCSFLLLEHLLVIKLLTYKIYLLFEGRFHFRAISCIGNEVAVCCQHCLPRG